MNRPRGNQLAVLTCPTKNLAPFEDVDLKSGLLRNPGIQRVEISRLEDQVNIFYDAAVISEGGVKAALQSPGYLVPGLAASFQRLAARRGQVIRMVASTLLLAGIVLASLTPAKTGNALLLGLLGGMILFSLPGLLRCIKSLLKPGRISADLMVWVIAIAAIITGRWLEAAGVIYLSVFADFLRLKTSQPTQLAGTQEESLLARLVTVREGENIREIKISEIQKDQVIIVRQGQMVPVDGTVLAGKAEIREAALTGESTYQTRTAGQAILAGAILESGSLDIKVLRAGKETMLASIDRLVNRALSYTDQTNRFMDRFIKSYVLGVIVLVVVVYALFGQYIFWSSDATPTEILIKAMTLLLAACPLALVLAGPLTLYAGLMRAALQGVLIKGGDVLEKLATIKVLMLDKTGTLTYAKPKVSYLKAFTGFTEKQVLEAALFVERQSSHPIARAICEYGEASISALPAPEKFMEFEGGGACAIKGDYYIKVGAIWLMEDGREISPEAQAWMADIRAQGLSFVMVGNRTELLGGFVLEDAIRENAASILEGLRYQGIERLVMVTGDNAQTAERVKTVLGIDEVEAECMPDKKLVLVQAAMRKGQTVGMVGDGINDAPALAAADVGIAMGTHSSDLAVEAADVALINNDIYQLYLAIAISKRTARYLRIAAIASVVGNLILVGLSVTGVITLIGGVLLQVILLGLIALLAATIYFTNEK